MASQTEAEEPAASSQLDFQEVMAAITSCRATLTSKIEAVQLDVGLIRQDLDKIRSCVTEVEQRVSQTEDTVAEHAASLQTLHSKVRALEYKMDDAKNKNWRNNLRVVGLPEGVEGKNPTVFVEDLLCSLLPVAQFSSHYYAVERAHRISPAPNPVGSSPRTLIFWLLNFRDRNEVLRAARGIGQFEIPEH